MRFVLKVAGYDEAELLVIGRDKQARRRQLGSRLEMAG